MSSTKNKSLAILVAVLIFIGFQPTSFARGMQKDSSLQKEYIVNMMHKVADWQLNAWNTTGFKHKKVDWTNAAAYTGLYAFGSMPGNDKYLDYLVGIGNDLNWNTGKDRFMADDYCIGQMYSLLYTRFKDKKMIASFIPQADSIVNKPHDEPLDWKNNIQSREWVKIENV